MKKDSLRKTVFSNEDVFCLFLNVVEAVHALVFSDWTQFILNADQLVVLRDTVCTAHQGVVLVITYWLSATRAARPQREMKF